jgi:hypothetical protein
VISLVLIIVSLVLAILACFPVASPVPLLPISVVLVCIVLLLGSVGSLA